MVFGVVIMWGTLCMCVCVFYFFKRIDLWFGFALLPCLPVNDRLILLRRCFTTRRASLFPQFTRCHFAFRGTLVFFTCR